jgi:hypothetical protein
MLLLQGRLKLIDFGSAKALFLPPTVRLSGNHRWAACVPSVKKLLWVLL